MDKLLYFIEPEKHDSKTLKSLLESHKEIKFVSLVAVDLGNNHTDEKIPINVMLSDIEEFLKNGVQTDGSSVYLPEIAELNDAKVDIIPDLNVKWFIDYNYNFIDADTNLPTGTLLIPSFLKHRDKLIGSRSVLKSAVDNFKKQILNILNNNASLLDELNIQSYNDIDQVLLTTATELEFWVQTPGDKAEFEHLSTSQNLKEQYWKRTVGPVRSAMEKSLIMLNKYGYEAEMGHKEVGGIPSSLTKDGKFTHIMEQLEIDWKYSNAMQTSDNELFAKEIIKDIFVSYGLDVTFLAKPIEGVAGSGEHTHVGVAVKLKDGSMRNLFTPSDMKKYFMSSIGWGSLMGLLKNYEVINPFITSTNDALNRLKPGFEAPVCIVSSIGHEVETLSRNRTILAGLIRDFNNPLATRFEVRVPNPTTNTYLATASIYQAMLDGIKAIAKSGKSNKELEKEFSKSAGEEGFYLEKDRAYRSEYDVFEHYTEEERNRLFGIPPATVWENISNLDKYHEKLKVLLDNDVFTEKIIASYKSSILMQWTTELKNRIIPSNIELVRECKKVHDIDYATDLDVVNWEKVNQLRYYLMKDSLNHKSLFTRIREGIDNKDYNLVSDLQIEMNDKITLLKKLYANYKRNLFNIY
ncbi:type I glutamate--ammonia ligase [Paramaledivibacter caminithermalis]|jgi:glutamine synthetase|uniref:glutamine synthetase n=1 Tax=Paramaledivibacter caminithermalis (strain DSM 15212 / CIP 107654 / DViRD3) TaxID=1121301 RepID=A0A1M6Q4H4_PARC5|nr:glutamine synthetase [Paramaledivibacter caminithermalis]SHK15174.1 glutamine synthetase [Paramaledivibacter caminithermalis DSM 15212]